MSGPTDADARTQDEGEIRAIVDRMSDSWARGDAVAHHADLTDDADYVAFDGLGAARPTASGRTRTCSARCCTAAG